MTGVGRLTEGREERFLPSVEMTGGGSGMTDVGSEMTDGGVAEAEARGENLKVSQDGAGCRLLRQIRGGAGEEESWRCSD
jgi:hypothetical protein